MASPPSAMHGPPSGSRGWLAWTFGVDPLTLKESLGISRRWQTYAFRALFVGVLGLAVWLFWRDLARAEWVSYSAYSEFGRRMFASFSFIQFALIALLGMAAGSDMVSREVRDRTLGMLVLTPLRPWHIAVGKWKSSMGYQTLVLLSGIPLQALAIYSGGVSGEELIAVTALTMAMGAIGTSLSVLLSAYVKNPYFTLGASFALIVLFALYPLSCFLHPVFSLFLVLNRGASATIFQFVWIPSCLVSLAFTWLFLHLAGNRIAYAVRTEPSVPVAAVKPAARGGRRFTPRWIAAIAERSGVWDSLPCLWREMRSGAGDSVRYSLWSAGGVLALFVPLILLVALVGSPGVLILMAGAVLLPLAILAGVAAGSSAFTRDKEEKRWETLLSTPVTATEILIAKLAAALAIAAPYYAAVLLLGILALLLVPGSTPIPFVVSTSAFTFFIVSIGLLFSLGTRNTRRACAFTLMAAAFFLAVVPSLSAWLLPDTVSDLLLQATNPFRHLRGVGIPLWGGEESWVAVALLALFYGVSGSAALASCWRNFDRFAGRIP